MPHGVNPLRLVSGIGWGSVHNYTQPLPRNRAPRRVTRKKIRATLKRVQIDPEASVRSSLPVNGGEVLSIACGVDLFMRTGKPVSRIGGSDIGYSLPPSFTLSTDVGPVPSWIR